MILFSFPWELYSHNFLWENFSIPRNILYLGIKFSELVTNIDMYVFMILFPKIYNYNFKQTNPREYIKRHLIRTETLD
jgi:hypothetical protein